MSIARQAMQQYMVIDLVTGTPFKFMAIPEEGWSEDKSVTWVDTSIIGRSSPLKGYQDSRPSRINLTIPLHSWVEQSDSTTPEDVKKAADFLYSLAYPDYSGGIKPPHKCLIMMGKQRKIKAVMSSCSIKYTPPFDLDTGLAYNATVTCTFEEVDDIPKDYRDVRNGG